jgi:hypothetical protein
MRAREVNRRRTVEALAWAVEEFARVAGVETEENIAVLAIEAAAVHNRDPGERIRVSPDELIDATLERVRGNRRRLSTMRRLR